MNKKLSMTALLLLVVFSANAQMLFLGKANQHSILGGENGKNFAAIFSTNCASRQEAMEKTAEFLIKYNLVQNKDSTLASVKEYDDTQSEFVIPASFRFGWHGTAPVIGAVASRPPVILKADLLFQYYDEGKVRLIIKNFEDFAYYSNQSKSESSKMKPENVLTEDENSEYLSFMLTPTAQDGMGKGIMKFLVFANAGAERISSFFEELDDIYHDIDRQVYLAQKLADGGYYLFGNGTDVIKSYRELIAKDDFLLAPGMVDTLEKELAEEKMIFVYDLFWRRDIKKQFDIVFSVVNQYLEGQIEAVAEDGEVTWQLDGGKLLPVDTKLKKKLQKAGQDYFSFYDLL